MSNHISSCRFTIHLLFRLSSLHPLTKSAHIFWVPSEEAEFMPGVFHENWQRFRVAPMDASGRDVKALHSHLCRAHFVPEVYCRCQGLLKEVMEIIEAWGNQQIARSAGVSKAGSLHSRGSGTWMAPWCLGVEILFGTFKPDIAIILGSRNLCGW